MARERLVQNEILRAYGTRPDMRLWRANVGVGKYLDRATGTLRVVRYGVPGQADLSGILPGGVRLEIEVKAPGGQQSDEQRNFERMVRRFGGVYVLAYSVADVAAALAPYLTGQQPEQMEQ